MKFSTLGIKNVPLLLLRYNDLQNRWNILDFLFSRGKVVEALYLDINFVQGSMNCDGT